MAINAKLTRKTIRICALVIGPNPRAPKEVARRFGVSRWAIYKRVSRARNRLAEDGSPLPPIAKAGKAARVHPVSQIHRNGVAGTTSIDDLR